MKRLKTEFIGTFVLAAAVGNALAISSAWAPVIAGLALAIVVYVGQRWADAHYNPAISIAAWRRGRIDTAELVIYVGVQLAGALLAAVFVRLTNAHGIARSLELGYTAKMLPGYKAPSLASLFLIEAIWTAVLAWVFLNVPKTRTIAGKPLNGLALGLTYALGAVIQGGAIYGIFNPAVHLSLVFMKFKEEVSIFLYWSAQIIGALAAGGGFRKQALKR